MTPRKELFIKIKEQLEGIKNLEYVDWQRGQFDDPDKIDPKINTAALILFSNITYENLLRHQLEGLCTVSIILYCKKGWTQQYNDAANPQNNLMEIDLLDAIAEKLRFLKGEKFGLLQQVEDENEFDTSSLHMNYTQNFETILHISYEDKYHKAVLNS